MSVQETVWSINEPLEVAGLSLPEIDTSNKTTSLKDPTRFPLNSC